MTLLLYVEDHPPARLLMDAIIHDLTPYTLITAGSCAEAKHSVVSRPDVYIVDLDLPDGDGITLIHELQAAHFAPAIITSAYESDTVANIPEGIFEYLRKPLDPDDVARTIQRAVARYR